MREPADTDTAFALACGGRTARADRSRNDAGSSVRSAQGGTSTPDGDLTATFAGVDSPCTTAGPFRATQVVE